VTAEFGIAESE